MNYARKKNAFHTVIIATSLILLVSHLAIYRAFSTADEGPLAAEKNRIEALNRVIVQLKAALEAKKAAETGRAEYMKKVMKVSAPFSALFIENPAVKMGEILTAIQGMAKEAGVIFSRLDTENESAPWSRDLDKEVVLNLGVKGDYNGVVKFLWMVRGSEWCFCINKFDLSSRGGDTEAAISLGIAFAKS